MNTRTTPSLIVRADDFGVTAGTNDAILDGIRAGSIRNCGILAAGPCIEYRLEELLAMQDQVCLGLHGAINSEWPGLRWGPVAPPETVPGLLADDGCFFAATSENLNRTSTAEILTELQAQWERLFRLGVRIRYVDSHMGYHWLPGVKEAVEAFCRRHGVLFGDSEAFPKQAFPPESARATAKPEGGPHAIAQPPVSVAVFHPAWNRGEEERVFGPEVAAQRHAEAALLASPEFHNPLAQRGLRPARYDEVAQSWLQDAGRAR